ncbi:MAG: hypothetical protein ABI693_30880, partial [Bryobacteraceae bacterium]
MNWIRELIRRLRYRMQGARFDEDLAEEMRLHLELRAEETGDAARRRFGNVTRMQEESRAAWGWTWMDTVAQDLRYGLRALA